LAKWLLMSANDDASTYVYLSSEIDC
jgi:hypothetical protein